MKCARAFTRAAFAATTVLSSSLSHAADYTFADIVNDTGEFDSLAMPVVNDAGRIAFIATKAPAPDGTGGEPRAYMATSGPIETFVDFGPASRLFGLRINDRNELAFVSEVSPTEYRLYRGSESGGLSLIATAKGTFPGEGFQPPTWLTDSGHVFYTLRTNDEGERLLKSDGVSTDHVAYVYEPGWRVEGVSPDGTLIGLGLGGEAPGWTFYKGVGTEQVALRAGAAYRQVACYRENENGSKVFWGDTGWHYPTRPGLYRGPDPDRDVIVNDRGPYNWFGCPNLNDAGTIAFHAGLDAGGHGIFVGPDPAGHRVIAVGDRLFGSTVEAIDTATPWYPNEAFLNDHGHIVFAYELANGVTGIALATPVPEPSLTIVSLIASFLMRRRRRQVPLTTYGASGQVL